MSSAGPQLNACVFCKHMRAKEMFYQNQVDDSDDRYKNSIFWCLKTQEIFGPDGSLVGRKECTHERPCFME